MTKKLSPKEVTELLQIIVTTFRMLAEAKDSPVAGVIFTDDTYESVKRFFGLEAKPLRLHSIESDPQMEHSFVVHGMLCLRGTPVNDYVPEELN